MLAPPDDSRLRASRPSSLLHNITCAMNGSSKREQPSGDEETERPERPVKRNRQVLSCLPCRDRKVACDRQHPCTGCVRYREPQRCVYLTDQAVEVASHTPHHASVRSESAVSSPLTTTRATANPFSTGRLQSKPNKTIYYVGPTAWSVPAPYVSTAHPEHASV